MSFIFSMYLCVCSNIFMISLSRYEKTLECFRMPNCNINLTIIESSLFVKIEADNNFIQCESLNFVNSASIC